MTTARPTAPSAMKPAPAPKAASQTAVAPKPMSMPARLIRRVGLPVGGALIALSLGLHINSAVDLVRHGTDNWNVISPAQAASEEAPATTTATTPDAPPAAAKTDAKAATAKADDLPAPGSAVLPNKRDEFGEVNAAEYNLLQQLQARREQLDDREKKLEEREALLTAAEKRVDDKVAELNGLKKKIEDMIGVADEKQQEQRQSLVKIYENMKPTQAARIMNTLDMPVLLAVVSNMKEAKSAPIIAEMDPAKAREITTALLKNHTPAGMQGLATPTAAPATPPPVTP